jgi:TonB dependent receptor/TonB-dependent Receptor Plug Domain
VRATLLVACAPMSHASAQSADPPPDPPPAPSSASQAPSKPLQTPSTAAPKSSSQPAKSSTQASQSTAPLEEVTVTAARLTLIGTATTASEGVVVNEELTLLPAYRPGQVLETVPGLDVTVHSGEGKANQYLMRGYNLDHGTDLAVYVDDMPVNEPTHAHGQGYADLNFMIPELATNVSYTKGTYYADEGDFASVGSVHVNYLDTIADQVSLSAGTLDFQRLFGAGSTPLGSGNLLGALELQHYDGPWVIPGDQRKVNTVLRFSSGDAQDGYSLTAMFYHDTWNAQTDQPERALTEGLLTSPYGELDPTDAGYAQRASLSWVYHLAIGDGLLTADAYTISNHLTLWNDFTHFLVDPVNGDQEMQHEDRATFGADTGYAWATKLGGIENDWLVGAHGRFDFNDVSRLPSQARIPLTPEQLAAADYPADYSERDQVRLSSVAAYVQVESHWTDWFRSVLGLRDDYMYGNDTGTNYGTASRTLAQPKVSLIFRPAQSTELYASAGRGFHSDDLRGVNQARIEGVPGAPLIASQTGEEVGVRQELFDRRVSATVALYNLVAESETTYDPDVGQDAAGPGSHRKGYEINITYQALRWLEFYGSYSGDHARFTSPYDDGTGHVGENMPNAPFATGSFNVYVNNLGPWSGGLAYRYLGAFPLSSGPCVNSAAIADFPGVTGCADAPTRLGQVNGSGYGEWNGEVHYAVGAGWSAGVGIYNILNTKANAMEYWYVDRLPGEPSYGVADLHFHPLEPISARFTISKVF